MDLHVHFDKKQAKMLGYLASKLECDPVSVVLSAVVATARAVREAEKESRPKPKRGKS